MSEREKQKAIDKIKARIREIEQLIKDVKRVDWINLVTERNSLYADLKRMRESRLKYQRKKPYMNTVSLKEWGI